LGVFERETGHHPPTPLIVEVAFPHAVAAGSGTRAEAFFETRELHRIVSDAIAELPDDLRQAVALHYMRSGHG